MTLFAIKKQSISALKAQIRSITPDNTGNSPNRYKNFSSQPHANGYANDRYQSSAPQQDQSQQKLLRKPGGVDDKSVRTIDDRNKQRNQQEEE